MKEKRSLYIHNIGQLVTCAGNVRRGRDDMNSIGVTNERSVIVIIDGYIAYAGPEKQLPLSIVKGLPRLDAKGACALPGFVDSHTHLVFGGYREEEFQWRLAGESYISIMQRGGGIASTMKETRNASLEDLVQSASHRLDAMLAQGVTTIEAKSGYGMDKETELRQLESIRHLHKSHPIDIYPTFMGAHDIPPEYKSEPESYVSFLVEEMLPLIHQKGLARCCDIFTEKGVFTPDQTKRLLEAAKRIGFSIKMHADEIVPYRGAELAAYLGCLSADHLLKISDQGIKDLAQSKTIATLLPLTAFSLRDQYAPARRLIDSGCAVALASDLNPGSCFSSSIPLLIALATLYMDMTLEETIAALTINAAAAIESDSDIGSLEPEKVGDVILLRFPSYKFLSYHFGMNIVHKVIKKGIVYENSILPCTPTSK